MGLVSGQEDEGDGQETSRTTRSTRLRSEIRIPPPREEGTGQLGEGKEMVASSQGKTATHPSPRTFSSESKERENVRTQESAGNGKGWERGDAMPRRERLFPSPSASYDPYLIAELENSPKPKIRPGDDVVLVSRASRRSQVEESVWQSKWD